MRELRPFLPAIVLAAGCAMILQTRSQRPVPLPVPVRSVAPSFEGGYTVTDQVLTKEEVAAAGMTDYVARVFTKDSVAHFTTLFSYYEKQAQGRTIHSPRNCLPGAGWEILTPGTRELTSGGAKHVVNHYVLKNASLTAIVLYWYQGRGRVVANEYTVKWNLLLDAATKGHTEEALVRVVVPIRASPQGDAVAMRTADSLGVAVANKLLASVEAALPK